MEVEVIVEGTYNDETGRAGLYEVGDTLITKSWYAGSLVQSGYCQRKSVRRQIAQHVSEALSVASRGRVLPQGPLKRKPAERHDVKRVEPRHEPTGVSVQGDWEGKDDLTESNIGPSLGIDGRWEGDKTLEDAPGSVSRVANDLELTSEDERMSEVAYLDLLGDVDTQQVTEVTPTKISVSPSAKKLAKENSIPLSAILGSGKDGRIVIEDVRKKIKASK